MPGDLQTSLKKVLLKKKQAFEVPDADVGDTAVNILDLLALV